MEKTSFSSSEDREWLITNGLGGYASSTLTGLNTRKYHGLLVAAFSPEDRRVFLSKIDEEIVIGDNKYPLFTNQYNEIIAPEGFKYQKGFFLNPNPLFTYEVPGVRVAKKVFMPHGDNAVIVEYDVKLAPGAKILFTANFLTTSRDHNWVLQNPWWDFTFKCDDIATLMPGHEKPPLICIGSTAGSITHPNYGDNRLHSLFYRKESERGYPATDDLFIGARLEAKIVKSQKFYVVCSADFSERKARETCEKIMKAPLIYEEKENGRKADLVKRFCKLNGLRASDPVAGLVASSDDFIIRKKGGTAIIAGYPWFGEWGRDSLISLPGLCLTTGRKKEAQEILLGMLKESENGMVPNNFSNGKGLNSLDASLWLIWSVWKYLAYTKDLEFVQKRLWIGIKKLMKSYSSLLDSDFLINTVSQTPMTWMDAIVDGNPVTLRKGKAVEIQALWYNALMVCSQLAERFGEKPGPYRKLAIECSTSFRDKFLNHENGYLHDVVDGNDDYAAIRPNALFAISLDFPILDEHLWKRVVDLAEQELVTPYGIRTLAQTDPEYRGSAQGNSTERDLAYHQGDAWPWLLGAFIDSYVKVYPNRGIGHFIKPLVEGHNRLAMGKVPEVYDGSRPHRPEGCISQAWSTAELMRILAEHQDKL